MVYVNPSSNDCGNSFHAAESIKFHTSSTASCVAANLLMEVHVCLLVAEDCSIAYKRLLASIIIYALMGAEGGGGREYIALILHCIMNVYIKAAVLPSESETKLFFMLVLVTWEYETRFQWPNIHLHHQGYAPTI